MKHKHHIIPKHAGGADEPSNIVELSVEEHANAHRLLYEQFGKWQDKLAWQFLSGQLNNAWIDYARAGGKCQGLKNKNSGHWKKISALGRTAENARKGG